MANSPDAGCTLERWVCGSRFSRFDTEILEIAKRYGIDAAELKAAAWSGSGFRSGHEDGDSVRGLCAVKREEGFAWAKDRGIETFLPVDLWDPVTALEVRAWAIKRDGRAGTFVGGGRFVRYLQATGFGGRSETGLPGAGASSF
jgi:hypothetical protein